MGTLVSGDAERLVAIDLRAGAAAQAVQAAQTRLASTTARRAELRRQHRARTKIVELRRLVESLERVLTAIAAGPPGEDD